MSGSDAPSGLVACPNPGKPVRLQLNRDLTRSLKRGHPWVFRDALKATPAAPPAAHAKLHDKRGRPLAMGYYDATGPLSLRVTSLRPSERPDDAWAAVRLGAALDLRRAVRRPGPTEGYRLFNGEGDGLPGLVCDVYADTACLRLDGPIAEAFWQPEGVGRWLAEHAGVARVWARRRSREGAQGFSAFGDAPQAPVRFTEHGLHYTADVVHGQKTGFFLDQRDNRRRVRELSEGRSVLNVFGYTGGFSVAAAGGGASRVTTVDIAPKAVEAAHEHMAMNGADDRHEPVAADAFAFLDAAAAEGRTWDVVVLDPPSFAPNQKAVAKALDAYTALFAAGAKVTAPGGFMAAASCSSHVSPEAFFEAVAGGVGRARRRGRVLAVHDQPADHPTPLAFRGFRYLKFVLTQVVDG